MTNDFERAFAALAQDADHAQQAAAPVIRKAADRRALHRVIAGGAAVAVVVAGIAVGATVGFGRQASPGPGPAVSVTPTVAPQPSVVAVVPSAGTSSAGNTPSFTPSSDPPPSSPSSDPPPPSSPSIPVVPKSVPAAAYLKTGDFPGDVRSGPSRSPEYLLPDGLCGASYGQLDRIAVAGGARAWTYAQTGTSADNTPTASITEYVTVYEDDAAEEFIDDLRAAVEDCPSGTGGGGVTFTNRLRGSGVGGDESLLIEQSRPAVAESGEPVTDGSTFTRWFAAIRTGDTIAVVINYGYESISAERGETEEVAGTAAQRLVEWRN